MTTQSSEIKFPFPTSQPHPYRWSVQEFHQLAEKGIFNEDDRIELIEGALLEMAPIGSDHAGHVKQLNRLFNQRLADKVIVSVQDPVILDKDSEPQPDLTLLRWQDNFYKSANPTAADVLLIIEVSDSTLEFDRNTKVPLYARHNIPEVWIINLFKRRVETYRKLKDGEYSAITYHHDGQIIAELIPDATLEIAELFA